MDLLAWTYLLVGLSFALYLGIAIWSRAGSTEEFYVAGGGVSPLANGLARLRWLGLPDGLDWRLCVACAFARSLPPEIWKIHGS
jgi:hypothetical protein